MNKKLSVIVPIYNTEKYLKKCLDSIIKQTYRNLEIILVNDGSTDSSNKICIKYAKKDNRIKVINKINSGISSARNIGIYISTGEYIAFIDSDDYIEENMFEEMMQYANEYELIICGISYIDENNEKINEYNPKLNTFNEICTYSFPCNKIFLKTLFKEIKFPFGKTFEDFYTIPKIYMNCKNVKVISESFYNYFQRGDSLSHRRNNIKMFDLLGGYIEIENYLNKNHLNNFLNDFYILKKNGKKFFLYKFLSLQSFKFKLQQYRRLKFYLKELKLWNFWDNFKYIFIVIYPRFYIKKIYYFMKGKIIR